MSTRDNSQLSASASGLGLDRRSFLAGAFSLAGLQAPLQALAGASAVGSTGGDKQGRSLVVLQLSGGNDGLSTIVPTTLDAYARARSATRIRSEETLRLDDEHGFHPALTHLRELHDQGALAIVEGVGYPNAIRSHFKSLEIWHTGRHAGRSSGDGWLARLAAGLQVGTTNKNMAVHVGGNAPYSLKSSSASAIAFESPSSYRWFGAERGRAAYGAAGLDIEGEKEPTSSGNSGRDRVLRQLRGVLDGARHSSQFVRSATSRYRPSVSYPALPLAARLHDMAALIHSDFGARIYSTILSGFDTHANQRESHDALMAELDAALGAFLADLQHSEVGRNTLVLVFSEFGRRLEENGSSGTDHGQAGPLFLLGRNLKGGLHGAAPSLSRLDRGDPSFTTDFRSAFASVIQDWMGVDSESVLGAVYPRLELFG